METLGDRLRKEREQQGLSLDDLAASTRIQKKFLQALEEGKFEALQATVFVVGFIRTYASALGLNPNPLIAEYEALRQTLKPAPPRVTVRRRPKSGRLPLMIGSAIVLFVVAAAIPLLKSSRTTALRPSPALSDEVLAFKQGDDGKDEGKTETSPEGALAQAIMPPLFEFQTAEDNGRPEKIARPTEEKAVPTPEIREEPRQPKERARIEPARAAPAVTSAPAQQLPPQTYAFNITLSAKDEDVWIYVVIDDADVRDMYIRAGKSVIIRGNKSFSLTTGNPLHLSVKVNGKPARIPGSAENKVVRNWLLPLDGQ